MKKKGCQAPGLCHVTGDPHMYSFDGRKNSFQGACKHIMVQDNCKKGIPNKEPRYTVAIENTRRDSKRPVSWVNKVIAVIDGRRIEMLVGGDVLLDGQKLQGLPAEISDDVTIEDLPGYVTISTTFGLKVQWDRKMSVRVTVHPDYMENICGMCGQYNAKPDDDFLLGPNTEICPTRLTKTRNPGQKAGNENFFGYSWMFEGMDSQECTDDCIKPKLPAECPKEEMVKARAYCKHLTKPDGPLGPCVKKLPDSLLEELTDSCAFDACMTDPKGDEVLCGAASELIVTCLATRRRRRS